MFKTVEEWKKSLPKHWGCAFADYRHPTDILSANEVMDEIVEYLGGISCGAGIRRLVEGIYSVNLEEVL